MIESKEKNTYKSFEESNFYGEWLPPKKGNIYSNIIKSFFYDGRDYAGDNLIFAGFTYLDDTPYIINDGNYKASLGYIGEKDSIGKNFKLVIKFPRIVSDAEFYYKTKKNDNYANVFKIDYSEELITPIKITIDEGFTITYTFDWDSVNNILTIYFSSNDQHLFECLNLYSEFSHVDINNTVVFEQYEIITEGTSLNGAIDCSTFASFLWAAKQGKIIKEKLFTCQNLIDETFEHLEFTKKFSANNYFIEYNDLNEVLNETEPGDILIFEQGDIKHCIFLIDPKNKIYTECSSFVTYNLGTFYNCKENPYNMENRISNLLKNSTGYLCRLL